MTCLKHQLIALLSREERVSMDQADQLDFFIACSESLICIRWGFSPD